MSATNEVKSISAVHLDLLFTASGETMVPSEETATVLNTLVPELFETVKAHHGVVEAVSNNTLIAVIADREDHALQAVMCSAALHAAARLLNESRVIDGKCPVKLRIGIGTGTAVLQTYDHPLYSGTSHVGASVAKAEALKLLAHPGSTLLSGDTYASVHEGVPCRLVKQLRLKNYDEELKAYEVLNAEEAAVMESLSDNRRKYPRLVLNLPVTLQVAQWSHRAEAINISAGGVLVACKDSFKSDTPVKISAVLPMGKRELPLRIEGTVIHCAANGDGRYAMGIKFKRLISEDREALEQLLSMILGEVLKDEELNIDTGEDAAGIRFYAYEASALLDDIEL